MNSARKSIHIAEDHGEGLVRTISKLKGESPEDGEFLKNTISLYPAHLEEYALKCIKECRFLFDLPENEIEPAFNLIFASLRRAQTQVFQDFADKMVSIFLEDTHHMAYIKIRVLSNFYNLISPEVPVRRVLLMAVLKLAADNNELPSMATHLKEIDTILDACNTSISDRGSVYLTISDSLRGDPNYIRESYEFTLKYLNTFEDAAVAENLAQTLPHSEAAIKVAINTAGIYTFDSIKYLKAIQYLFEKQPLYRQIIDLLISGDISGYFAFTEKNAEFMADKGFNLDSALTKIRYIVLCKVFEKNINVRLPFKTLADAINVPVDQIENWITNLVQEELASVMINQKSHTVTASRCLFTEFGKDQWMSLKKKLQSWESSTAEILEVLINSRFVLDSIPPQKILMKK